MAKFILAGTGRVDMYSPNYTDYIGSSKTLTESGISLAVTAEEIRGGLGNSVLGQYFHDTGLTLNMTDALFSLEYLALNVGGTISAGATVVTMEQVTVGENGVITVSNQPQEFLAGNGYIAFVKRSFESEDAWRKVTFDEGAKTATTSFAKDDVVCVRYCMINESARKFKISSAFIPSQISIILTFPLFKTGTDAQSFTDSSKVGEIQIKIPNFMFDGAQDLSLTASGAATTSLSGKALVTYTGSEGCEDEGYYGEIIEVIYNKDEFADVKAIVVADANLDMLVDETKKLEVLAIYNGVTAPKVIDNSKLTFAVDTAGQSHVTVSNAGVVTALSAGKAEIKVTVTGHETLDSAVVVTVTA
jgi:hypothetical protein